MHLHAEHPLFFQRGQPKWRAALSLGVTLCVLLANAGAGSVTVSLLGFGVGAGLLLVARARGHRRVAPALTWTLLAAFALLCGAAWSHDVGTLAAVAARALCGAIWVLWLGTQVDWAALRRILRSVRVPETVLGALDHALMHGVFTRREWAQRQDAARLRMGAKRLPLSTWGPLLGEGALQAFFRLERVEESALLRSSASTPTRDSGSLQLSAVDVLRRGGRVLEQLDLKLAPGEWMLLCGPSGAGKSSLLRLLAGLEGPERGTMTRFGVHIPPGAGLGARLDGRVALLGQNPEHQLIASTVGEDIAWGLLRRGVGFEEAQRRSAETAAALRVDHLLHRPCHELSFGEQRRVVLAGLLVLEPSLLLLDEPTSGLDPVAAHELHTLVEQSVRRTGAACIWATHDLHAVPPQASRVVLLRQGRVLFDGAASAGLGRPWLLRAGLAAPSAGDAPC